MRRLFSIASCIFLISGFFVLSSCEGLFIPDPIDPRLPKYTEDGNGVAGAFINGKTWRSQVFYGLFQSPSNIPQIISYPDDNSLNILFFGETQYAVDSWRNEKLGFYLKDINVQSFEELAELNGQKLALDGTNNYGSYQSFDGGTGQLFLKHIVLNDSLDGAVISGTFGFSVPGESGEKTDVHYGRFDYRIRTDDFRIY